jgi:pimeloyl-ACP methyl ester carboxylesterase
MFVQGIGPGTVDFALTADNGYARIIQPFARSGYVTLRVDKPGVGDSEGGPFAAVDFQQTLDGYRQALKALLARPDVDPERVFLFGHSMGGYWGPLLAREFKLKGIAVSGTAFRTWIEYDLENTRRQGTLGGTTPLDMHNLLQDKALLNSAWLLEGLDLNQITARYPRLKQLVTQSFVQTPSGPQYSGQHMRFWQQVAALNMPEVWAGASGQVLALYGASDFLTDARDHELLVSWVNFMRPDSARFVQLANSDHAFLDTATQRDSLLQWGKPGGKVNPNILPVLNEWVTPLSGVPLKL